MDTFLIGNYWDTTVFFKEAWSICVYSLNYREKKCKFCGCSEFNSLINKNCR